MNAKKLFFFVLMLVGLVSLDNSKVYAYSEPFVDELPSLQTEQELQNFSETAAPGLRARPTDVPETERPQKIPLGNLGWFEISFLGLFLFAYAAIRKKKVLRREVSLIALFVLSSGVASAQIKATPDNYFVEPGRTQFFQILLNDDPGTCSELLSDLDIELVSSTLPNYATDDVEVILSTNQRVRVATKNTVRGQWEFKYKITCKYDPSLTSEASVFLNFAERPDFIDAATCTTERPKMVWDIQRKYTSAEQINIYGFTIVGDVDGDGEIEIVSTGNSTNNNDVLIFNNQLKLKDYIVLPATMDTYTVQAMAMADVDPVNDDGPELLIATGRAAGVDRLKLFCYKYDHAKKEWKIKWRSTEDIFSANTTINNSNVGSTISVADIDSDGLVEILVGDRVFSGGDSAGENGGQLLATMPVGGRGFITYGTNWAFFTCFADINGDGIQEIVAGNTTYSAVLNHDVPSASSISLLATSGYADGIPSVADIDGDGILDVLTAGRLKDTNTSSEVYVWQGSSPNLIGQNVIRTGARGSRIFAGDMDGDGTAEFALTKNSRFDAYKYDKASDTFSVLFTTTTSDGSGSTTMTMFDFDNDGKSELVYRDETLLRIIGKHPVTGLWGDLVSITCFSNTHTEYPTVADINGDGHAEIIVSGGPSSRSTVYAMVFGSITPGTWSPARAVWHQHGYNPTQINEDLTVPKYPLSSTSKVITRDGDVRTPYNSFLQQAGILNTEGEFINKSHDLAFLNRNQGLSYDDGADIMTVTAYFTNEGSADYSGNLLLGFYGYNGTTQTYHKITEKVFASQTVAVYDQKSLNLSVAGYSSLPNYDRFFLTINLKEDGTNAPDPYYLDQKECIAWNNLTSRFSYMSGYSILCEGESGTLALEPAGVYDCYWYTLDTNGNRVPYPSSTTNMGDSKSVTKQAAGDTDIYVIVPCKPGTTNPISFTPDTAFVYTPMDSLVWTGASDKDWHNTYNWRCPADPSVTQRFRYIPRGCTNVLIPSETENSVAITTFPNLVATETDYTTYADSKCNNITFDHDGEVVYVDHLIYSKAFVNVDMLSNRWYGFSAPLRDFYSGDVYKESPNPFTDNLEVNTRLYSQTDPEYGIYREGTWGPAFATPTYKLGVGQGMGIWLDDHEPNPLVRANVRLSYPKDDTEYYMYYWDTGAVQSGPYTVDKDNQHRFIFEENINPATKEVKLQVEAKTAGKEIMIGNPYMSHLDFDKFYEANSDKIDSHYKVIDETYSYPVYYKENPTGSTGTPRMTKDIAPMQAFIVKPKIAIDPAVNPLVTNTSMMLSTTSSTLRSAKETTDVDVPNNYIRISVSDVMKRSKTSIIVDESANPDFSFDNKLDVMKTIKYGVKEYPVIYTIANGGTYAEIKSLASIREVSIPLGLCYDGTGLLALGFENIRAFTENCLSVGLGYHLYLEDKLEDRIVEITESSPIYSFNKDNADTFTNDRFVLRISQSAMAIEEFDMDQPINVSVKGNQLLVTDVNGESLEQVVVYSMHGVLACNTRTADSSFSAVLNPGVYIVKVKGMIRKVVSE